MLHCRTATAAIAVTLGLAAPVMAMTIDIGFQEDGNVFGTPDYSLKQLVSFTEGSTTGTFDGRGGMFRLKYDTNTSEVPPVVTAPTVDFTAFCVELLENIFDPGRYTLQNTAYGALTYGATAINRLGTLISTYYSSIDTAVEGNAFQLAVWEITKEGSGALDLNAGNFKVTTDTPNANQSSAITTATAWLTAVSGATDTGGAVFAFMTSNLGVPGGNPDPENRQDLIAIGVTPVPVPAGVLLMGTAALGLAALRRRRRAA
jgi:hypothetical protein